MGCLAAAATRAGDADDSGSSSLGAAAAASMAAAMGSGIEAAIWKSLGESIRQSSGCDSGASRALDTCAGHTARRRAVHLGCAHLATMRQVGRWQRPIATHLHSSRSGACRRWRVVWLLALVLHGAPLRSLLLRLAAGEDHARDGGRLTGVRDDKAAARQAGRRAGGRRRAAVSRTYPLFAACRVLGAQSKHLGAQSKNNSPFLMFETLSLPEPGNNHSEQAVA